MFVSKVTFSATLNCLLLVDKTLILGCIRNLKTKEETNT
jgi:hypothetical protein